jgi:hypothetical protein
MQALRVGLAGCAMPLARSVDIEFPARGPDKSKKRLV